MNPHTIEVNMGGLKLRVPTYESVEKTHDIIHEINERLKILETTSTKINTQAFALLAAYEYAKSLRELRDEIDLQEREVADRVSQLTKRIHDLTRAIEEAT